MQVKKFKVEHCNIQNTISNIFTKVLSREKHEHCMKLIRVIDLELEKEDSDTQLLAFVALSINPSNIPKNVINRKT
jgi:hypothetical protein